MSKDALAKSKDERMTIFICLMSLITYRVLKSFRYAINAMFKLIICYKKISSIFLCKFENNSSKNAPPPPIKTHHISGIILMECLMTQND